MDALVPEDADLIFLEGFSSVPLRLAAALVLQDVPVACPPIHTLALLDHPLHWRRVLEREGVPLSPWLHLGPEVSPERDSRISVLGFPLEVEAARPGCSKVSLAADRGQLRAVSDEIGGAEGIVVQRVPQGEAVSAFTGVAPSGPLLTGSLDVRRAALTLELARYIERILELAGPCEVDMTWEPGRLLVRRVRLVEDLGPSGRAFCAVGGTYESFVDSLIQATMARCRRAITT